MASNRLRIAAIAALLAALTAIGCTAEAEQPSVSERVIDCDIESMDTFDDPVDGKLEHLTRALSVALDDPDSEEWRCELLAGSVYARLMTREDFYYDGPIFADGLVAAAHARTWPDAQRVFTDAWERALGPYGWAKLEQELEEIYRQAEQYEEWNRLSRARHAEQDRRMNADEQD